MKIANHQIHGKFTKSIFDRQIETKETKKTERAMKKEEIFKIESKSDTHEKSSSEANDKRRAKEN